MSVFDIQEKPAALAGARDALQLAITGSWLKEVRLKDEEWLLGQAERTPEQVLEQVRSCGTHGDWLAFAQHCIDSTPRYAYHFEWDNVAVVPITTYTDWWENKLPQVTRKNVRRGYKRGVRVEIAEFNDALVRGISRIYNETPVRQGRKFPHYGKDLETVRRENSSYLDRSDFIAAYLENELIGFIKLVYVDSLARIMQIVALDSHADKRPTNILLAKAVEICCEKNLSHFVFGKYVYGKKVSSPVTEFKRRNGFEKLTFPVYYIPLNGKGRMAMALKLHLGIRNLIPEKLMNRFLHYRSMVYSRSLGKPAATEGGADAEKNR